MKPYADIEVIKEMIIKSREKLKTAQIDLEHERYDDSVSRSYYAVYHAISAVLFSKRLHFSSHAQTIGTFNKEFVKTKVFPSSFTKTIEKLFNERQIGDYDFETHLDAEVAQEDLTEAEKIIEACEEYLAKAYNVSKEYWKR
ncbi:MAG TPA: HEPN domain-containing protein [Candidatus Brocadiales bacterium]|nr:HEPN domain-containing protein [Candidatus Brocadiales bacterium]